MRKVLIILLILIVGFGLGVYSHKVIPNKQAVPLNSDNRQDTLISLGTLNGILDIGVYKGEICFEPFENAASPYKSFCISKEVYPKLFEQGVADSSFVSAEVIKDEEGRKILVLVSNNQPDHGSYSPTYQLIIDPIMGEIEEYRTNVETFVPEIPSKTVKGNCWTSSLTSPLNDKAWRCMTGNFIYDPCFETTSSEIICNSFPNDTSKAFILDLEKALPERSDDPGGGWRFYSKETPNNENDFWILELEDGYRCYAMAGTLPFINKQTFYYNCIGDGEAKYAGQVQVSTPVFTTTIVSGKFGEQENVDWSNFKDIKILRVWY